MERVVIAFASERICQRVKEIIEQESLAVCTICRSGAEVKRVVAKQGADTVVCGFKLPDTSAVSLREDLPPGCPVLLVANQGQLDLCDSGELFKLAAPVSRGDLIGSVKMLLQLHQKLEGPTSPRRSEEEQSLIQAAKSVLMHRNGMTEEEAHRFLQKRSMDQGVKLADTARMVLDSN